MSAKYNSINVGPPEGNIPYITTCTELGYFSNPGVISSGKWSSLIANIITNNGIATVSNSLLKITNPGIYRLSVGINVTTTSSAGSLNTIQHCFTTTSLYNQGLSNAIGGNPASYNYTYSPNNASTPGILLWHVNAYNTGNSTASTFSENNSYLVYNYYAKSNSSQQMYPGICTSEIVLYITNSNQIVALCLSGSDVDIDSIDSCYYVLTLLSNLTVF